MTGNRATTGIVLSGLVIGLSGCLGTVAEDIPFVARLNADNMRAPSSVAADGEQVAVAKNPFAFLKPNETGEGDADTKAKNPFAFLSGKSEQSSGDSSDGGGVFASLFARKDAVAQPDDAKVYKAAQREAEARAKESAESTIISGLQMRRSILPQDSAYDRVASNVLAANSRAAEAQLRAARLRAVAASKNWLPSIGPSISLSSLGDLVASLVVEQVLFDNGRKKAERAFAKADVEVAAVTLSQDTNQRVFTALDLYLNGQQSGEKALLATEAFNDMSHFEYIMSERVRGGVSDRSDLVVLRQKLAEIKSEMALNTEARATALAELNAMSLHPLQEVSGVPEIDLQGVATKPLPILLAEAEKERAVAEATAERASHLPGLNATGSVGTNGNKLGLNVAADKLLGLGTGASLRAIDAAKEGAQRQVAQAREDSNRRLRSMESKLRGLERQLRETRGLTSQSKKNLDLFQAQYKAGTRQVMDVVGVYETYARQQQNAVDLKYKAAKLKLEIANELGLLASGAEI